MKKVLLSMLVCTSGLLIAAANLHAQTADLAKRTAEINSQKIVISNTCHTVWWAYHRATWPAAFASSDGLNGDAPRKGSPFCVVGYSRTEAFAQENALRRCNVYTNRRHLHPCSLVASHG